jgi:hypothetical protein
MFLHQVISYGNAWNKLLEDFPGELEDIRESVAELTPENIAAHSPP